LTEPQIAYAKSRGENVAYAVVGDAPLDLVFVPGFVSHLSPPSRVRRAPSCARALGAEAAEIGIEIRAGLHTGECELIGDDIGGMCIHLAARVCALAGPHEVLVSRTVKDLVVGSGIRFAERGAHELKGAPGEWELFSVE
jgi:class 3 adenylate cyclase